MEVAFAMREEWVDNHRERERVGSHRPQRIQAIVDHIVIAKLLRGIFDALKFIYVLVLSIFPHPPLPSIPLSNLQTGHFLLFTTTDF
jgi:hypothetical protein